MAGLEAGQATAHSIKQSHPSNLRVPGQSTWKRCVSVVAQQDYRKGSSIVPWQRTQTLGLNLGITE